jgi:hypothetical protein
MDETRTRFLAAIAKQLPAERIAEAHLFAAIRQGGVESGVAVIALEPEQVEAPQEAGEESLAAEAAVTSTPDDATGPAEPSETFAEADVSGTIGSADADSDRAVDGDDDSPYATDAETEPAVVVAPAPPRRYVVCTARYRHTLKGPDRGKWEVTVTEEADAPLLTVDAVVRGVQRRSGDLDEIVRLSGDELRAALPVPATP